MQIDITTARIMAAGFLGMYLVPVVVLLVAMWQDRRKK